MNKDRKSYLRLRENVQYALDRLEHDNNTAKKLDSGDCADIIATALDYPTINEVGIVLEGLEQRMTSDLADYTKDWESEDRNGDSYDFMHDLRVYLHMVRFIMNSKWVES